MGIGTRPFKATVSEPEQFTAQSGKLYFKAKLRTGRKDRSGAWQNEYWRATLFQPVADKDKIQVEEFTLEQRQYEKDGSKRTAYDMTIWKFNVLESAPIQQASDFSDVITSDFSELDEPGELPF